MINKTHIMSVLHKFWAEAVKAGLQPYCVALKGSQNYNLSDDDSDVDANLVFIPTLPQLRKNEKFKFTLPEGEVTCHNIYSFAEIVAKGNPQWIEVCNTPYYVGEPLDMFKHYKLNPSALKGMVMEKVHAFSKLYPSRESIVKRFGYDPKQLHHIIRLFDCLNNNVNVYVYSGVERNKMMDIKRGRFPETVEEAMELRDCYVTRLNEIYEQRKLAYAPQPVDYDAIDKVVLSYYRKEL